MIEFVFGAVFFIVDPDVLSQRSNYRSTLSVNEVIISEKRDFKIMVEIKSNTKRCIHLVAPTVQDKEAWISDISQCIDNIHLHSLMSPTTESIGNLAFAVKSPAMALMHIHLFTHRSTTIVTFRSETVYR